MKRKKIIAGMMAAGLLVSCVAIPSVAAMSKFIDVRDDAWYADAVNVASGHNMVRGTGNGQFAPNAALTRAELVQILYNHAGKPATRGSSSFTDVVSSAWYSDAVQWAAESGIVHGTGGNQFQPEGLVTREQFAVLLYHYAMNTGASPLVDIQLLKHYHDGSTVSSWAETGVAWAVKNKIMRGTDTGKLLPRNTTTRAEAAQMLNNYLELTGNTHVYVQTDIAGKTEYICTVCGHIKPTAQSNTSSSVKAGVYLVPNSYDMLYVEQPEGSTITFTAWWFHDADISDVTAELNGNTATFDFTSDATGQTASGSIQFDDAKATLYLTETSQPIIFHEKTEYIWLRDSMWELSDVQLEEIGRQLGVPQGLDVTYTQDEAYYWDAGGCYATYVQVACGNKIVATATVDSFTGELLKDIWMYTP